MDTYKVRLDGRDLKGIRVKLSPNLARVGRRWKLHDKLTDECAKLGNKIKVDTIEVTGIQGELIVARTG